jgi:RNA polymerase sigma factor (sigma-70 family)
MEPIVGLATLHTVSVESTDESEWSKALLGDGEAFGVVFDRHRARVFRHSYRLLDSSADADDLVSIVFLEAWRRRHSLRFVDGSMLPWLLVTATNSARNLLRKSRRYRQVLSELPLKTRDENELFDSQGGDAQTLMRELSINDQRVLTLCLLEGFSEREAAKTLGVPVGTVKSRLSRAKSRLAQRVHANRQGSLTTEVCNEQ